MADLISVVVGGLLATGGGGATQWFLYRTKEKSDQKRIRAEKFEQLLTTIFAHKHWLDLFKDEKIFGEQKGLPEAPIARALALATAYLPELAEDVSNLETASKAYEIWMLEAGQKRLAKEKNYLDGHTNLWEQYLLASAEMMKEAIAFQKEHLK